MSCAFAQTAFESKMNPAQSTLHLQIITPEARFFEGEATLVELPTQEGQIGVYPGHVRLVAGLGAGDIRVHSAEGIASFMVLGGYVEIEPTRMSVLALFASPEDEKVQIEEALCRAKAALELAENQPPGAVEDDLARLRIELSRGKKGAPVKRHTA